MPAAAKEPGMFTYNTTKVQDNFWLTAGEAQPLYWILDGGGWEDGAINELHDQCLARMTYFGRAESITAMQRVDAGKAPAPNCQVADARTSDSVPILCPRSDVTLDQLQLTTDDPAVRNSTVPPGAVWQFVRRPPRPPARPRPRPMKTERPPIRLLQFALSSKVAPTLDHVALIANWFRGRAIRHFLADECGVPKGDWNKASAEQKNAAALLAGKSSDNKSLSGHRHAFFGLYLDRETGKPTRLLAWRSEPFSCVEQEAIIKAAAKPFSLAHGRSSKGQQPAKRDPWKVHCVPLDSAVPRPPGFDPHQARCEWVGLTPYVPPRHVFNRQGKPKPGESPAEQLAKDLDRAGLPKAEIHALDRHNSGQWVKVHRGGKSNDGASNLAKRGHYFHLTFEEPVSGPIALGHSCHFGLGLFVPADSN
jgi:CRISPR-associated protein Csb2